MQRLACIYGKKVSTSLLYVEFLIEELSVQLNRMFNSDDVYRILQGEDGYSIDIIFPYLCSFFDKATGYKQDGKLTKGSFFTLS